MFLTVPDCRNSANTVKTPHAATALAASVDGPLGKGSGYGELALVSRWVKGMWHFGQKDGLVKCGRPGCLLSIGWVRGGGGGEAADSLGR